MDVAAAADDEKAAAKHIMVYWLDLVSFRLVRSGPVYRGLVLPDADTFMLCCLDGSLAKEDSVDVLNILDRSALYVGQIVVSASDAGGQIGVVTGVTTVLDLAHLNDRGRATKVIRGVSPSGVRRVRTFSLGDYVVSGPWLGRVVAFSLTVDVMFTDGAVCRVTEVESKDLRPVNPEEYYRPRMNTHFYPSRRVVTSDSADVFKEAQWLNGHWKPDREVGMVVNVETAGVMVYWIASAQHGTKQQLVRESAPPAYQSPPDTLTFLCSAPDCCWGLADRCFLADPSIPQQHAQSAPQPTMTVCRTHTAVDVLWQDGMRQHGAPSTSLVPFSYMNEHDVFPGQYVVDHAPSRDDVVGGSTRRVGFVRSLNSKDHTVNVSWFKDPDSWKVECDDTVSAYDLGRHPDHHSIFYGDVVVRLPSDITGAEEKSVPADLLWVGHVVDLHDGHVQVKWGDGSTSMVLPNEISIANKEDYAQLLTEMADWPEFIDDAPQELDAANEDNQQHNPTDARNAEGGMVEGSDSSVIELGGPNTNTQNVEVTVHVAIGSHEVPNISSTVPEVGFALATRSNASDDDNDDGNDSSQDVVMIKATYVTGADGPFKFPHFDVLQSPPDHHYLNTMEQGINCGKKWAKTVQKEWKILENSLPDNIYVRAFEDRMDLLRAVMVGASGTPYHNGLFFFDLQLPPSYPFMPPQLYYHSFGLRLNPNLYESGTVCLSLLNTFGGEGTEVWSPGTSSLLQVVVSLQALVLNDQPYYNEAGYEHLVDTSVGRRNALPYREKAFLFTLRTALHLLQRPPKGFDEFIRDHFRLCGRHVLETCHAYLHGCMPADHGSTDLLSSTGFRIALANMVPSLMVMFMEIGAEGCDERLLTSLITTP